MLLDAQNNTSSQRTISYVYLSPADCIGNGTGIYIQRKMISNKNQLFQNALKTTVRTAGKFGGLWSSYHHQIKIHQNFFLSYLHMAILYWSQYFWLYST